MKLLVDLLNEEELARACGGALPNEKSIGKLMRYLETQKYPYMNRDNTLLRNLQELRSSGAVHHKGKKVDKIGTSVGLDRNAPPKVFRNLLLGVTGIAPPEAPPGEHEVTLIAPPDLARAKASRHFGVDALPTLDLGSTRAPTTGVRSRRRRGESSPWRRGR